MNNANNENKSNLNSQSNDQETKNTQISDKNIKNHVLYLSTDQLIDLYLKSKVGTDERVYLSHALLEEYGIDNPEVHYVNVNGVNIKVSEFKDIAMKDPDYVLENHHIPKNDSDRFEELQQLSSSDDDKQKNLDELDKIAKDKPITQIKDDDRSLEEKYNQMSIEAKSLSSSNPTSNSNENLTSKDLNKTYFTGNGYSDLPAVYTSPLKEISDSNWRDEAYVKNIHLPVKSSPNLQDANAVSNIVPNLLLIKESALLVSPNITKKLEEIPATSKSLYMGETYHDVPEAYFNSKYEQPINTRESQYVNNKILVLPKKVYDVAKVESSANSLPIYDTNLLSKQGLLVSPYIESKNNLTSPSSNLINTGSGYTTLPDIYTNHSQSNLEMINNINNTEISSKNLNNSFSNNDDLNSKKSILVSPNSSSINNYDIEPEDNSEENLVIDHGYSVLPEIYTKNLKNEILIDKENYYVKKNDVSNKSNNEAKYDDLSDKKGILVSQNIISKNSPSESKDFVQNTGHGYTILPNVYWDKNFISKPSLNAIDYSSYNARNEKIKNAIGNSTKYSELFIPLNMSNNLNHASNILKPLSENYITLAPKEKVILDEYQIDDKRKIYVIEEKEAKKIFGDNELLYKNKKVLVDGNVLSIYSNVDSGIFNAPYAEMNTVSSFDNIFFLPNDMKIAIYKNIQPTSLIINNFEVNVSNIDFILPKGFSQNSMTYNANLKFPFFKNIELNSDVELENQLNVLYDFPNEISLTAEKAKELGINYDSLNKNGINLIYEGVNQKINIINLFNEIYALFFNKFSKNNRRLNYLYKMMRQMMFDSSYYVENQLLVLNYAETLIFLVNYFNLNNNIILDVNKYNNPLLYATLEDAIQKGLNYIPSVSTYKDDSYNISKQYCAVYYKNKVFDLLDNESLDTNLIDEILLNRPQFDENELSDFFKLNPNRANEISPYINILEFVNTFLFRVSGENSNVKEDIKTTNFNKEEVKESTKNSSINDTVYLTKQEFDLLSSESQITNNDANLHLSYANKFGLDNPYVKYINVEGVIYPVIRKNTALNKEEFSNLAVHGHVFDDTLYISKEEINHLGLDLDSINSVSIDGRDIPMFKSSSFKDNDGIYHFSPSKINELIKKSDLRDEVLYSKSIDLDNLDAKKIKFIYVDETDSLVPVMQKTEKEIPTNDVQPIINNINNIEPVVIDSVKTETTKQDAKDNHILVLTKKQIDEVYKHSKITNDGILYLDPKESSKLGILDNPNVKYIKINDQLIPVEQITKQKMKEELSHQEESTLFIEKDKKPEKVKSTDVKISDQVKEVPQEFNSKFNIDKNGTLFLSPSELTSIYKNSNFKGTEKDFVLALMNGDYLITDENYKRIAVNGSIIQLLDKKNKAPINDIKKNQ